MSVIGENLLLFLNQIIPNQHSSLLKAKFSAETYNSYFADRASSSFAQFGSMDLKNHHVLDIGCGLGANIDFLASIGAAHITGLDIRESQINSTKRMFFSTSYKMKEKLSFTVADAASLPFESNSFDSMIAADTFEHIDDLQNAMNELARVLKPGGNLYAYFPPFYAPWGAHMVNWITVPWCQVFFSEKTILNAARRLERDNKAINSHLPVETKLNLGNDEVIPFVNHLTIKRFLAIVESIPTLRINLIKLLVPNWRNGNNSVIRVFSTLNRVPVLREMFTAKAVFILQKQ